MCFVLILEAEREQNYTEWLNCVLHSRLLGSKCRFLSFIEESMTLLLTYNSSSELWGACLSSHKEITVHIVRKGPKFLKLNTWLGHPGDRVISMHTKSWPVVHAILPLLPLFPVTTQLSTVDSALEMSK